jgi:hypothetical protein
MDCIDIMIGYDAIRRVACQKKETRGCSAKALDCILCDGYKEIPNL